MIKEEIGQIIAAKRKERGISIRALASLTKTSTRTIQAVEKGWYDVGIDTYTAITDALNLEIEIKDNSQRRKMCKNTTI